MDRLATLETGFEGYPPDYIYHNVPFVLLSGLKTKDDFDDHSVPVRYREGALHVKSELPLITGESAEALSTAFRKFERSEDHWHGGTVVEGSIVTGFRFKRVGRNYQLLPRKAKPPSQELGFEPPGSPNVVLPPHWILHSPFSPLTPASPLFPDGVLSPEWLAKHQHHVPCVFMSFIKFEDDPTRNSLSDNQVKNEINHIKATLYKSEHKTKLVIVLTSDTLRRESPEVEDRLTNIRRACNLDAKTQLFFFPRAASSVEVDGFANTVLTGIQPGCVEYYRDLTKHARRKKNRGSIPAPTAPPTQGTSQTLSALGWGIRYDFKLGVFAEFRQEMESACRHYTAALEALLGPDGVFEMTASWSPRWEEARLLADAVAMRILRCLLWSDLSTTAAQSWANYRLRLREVVDGRGKGSTNYGWQAWESRWSRIMAELVRRARLKPFASVDGAPDMAYIPQDKTIAAGERLRPFDHLHHPGYWSRLAARHSRQRRRLALELPEDDCVPPEKTPASAMASRYRTYDVYLCPEPWQERPNAEWATYDHSKDICNALKLCEKNFRAQTRQKDEIALDVARELMRCKKYAEATEVAYRLWKSMKWRQEKWWALVFETTRILRESARHSGDLKALTMAEFELYSADMPTAKTMTYDLMCCGEGLETSQTSVIEGDVIELYSDQVASFISADVVFATEKGDAGEPVSVQIVLRANAQPGSAPVIFDTVDVHFGGASSVVKIKHQDDEKTSTSKLQDVTLSEESAAELSGFADLRLGEGSMSVIEFLITFREPGNVTAERIILHLSTVAAKLEYSIIPSSSTCSAVWYAESSTGLLSSVLPRDEPFALHVRPRPPKMDIKLPNAQAHFYTDEEIEIRLELTNREDEETNSTVEVNILSDDSPVDFSWIEPVQGQPSKEALAFPIGTLAAAGSKAMLLGFKAPSLPASYAIEVKVVYHLESDPATPVTKLLSSNIKTTRAFEANYELQPRVHPESWPSFFTSSTVVAADANVDEVKHGIVQRYELVAQIASFTYEGIIMSGVELRHKSVSNNASVVFSPSESEAPKEEEVAPQQQLEKRFVMDVTKISLEDRRSIDLDLVLAITWHRASGTAKKFTSLLPVSSYILDSAPRVLASVSYAGSPTASGESGGTPDDGDDGTADVPFAHLSFTLENPTTHFLTFELSMDAPVKEDWAMSGPKLCSLNLLPLSRETISYRLLPLAIQAADQEAAAAGEAGTEARWLEVRLRVLDVYFRKMLRCMPASRGVREADGKGGSLLVWVGRAEEWGP